MFIKFYILAPPFFSVSWGPRPPGLPDRCHPVGEEVEDANARVAVVHSPFLGCGACAACACDHSGHV